MPCSWRFSSMNDFFFIDTSELTHLLFGGTAGVTTRIVFAAEDGGRSLISTEVNFPFHNNITTSAFVSYFKAIIVTILLHTHTIS